MPIAEMASGDNVVPPISPTIATRSEMLRSGLVPQGSFVRYTKAFAEHLNVISPHRLATIVTKATLLLHSCITVVD
jgi:hypothetical protein